MTSRQAKSKLRRRREEKGRTLQDFADELGVSKAFLSTLERGLWKTLDFEIAQAVCEKYGVSFDDLKALREGAPP
ncbi:MAG: helix-turn-helix transcriptional regulator [Acidobacteriota bacterium]